MIDTDHSLLEAAARAAGLKVLRSRLEDPMHRDFLIAGNGVRNLGQNAYPWNPLNDDGDALRLAVKLGIGIGFHQQHMTVIALQPWPLNGFFDEDAHEAASLDELCASSRRAVVRAAAAMAQEQSK